MIAVSSEHRIAAIEAAHFAIDELKRTVPIWKKVVLYYLVICMSHMRCVDRQLIHHYGASYY